MGYMHNIYARLYNNPLTEEPNDLFARIKTNKTLDVAAICEYLAERGRTTVTATTMEVAVREFFKGIEYLLGDGYAIDTPVFRAALRIKGVFNAPNDHFDPQRHKIIADYQESSSLRKYIDENVSIIIDGMADDISSIGEVIDMSNELVNSTLTLDEDIVIRGTKIKIAGDNPDVGIWFRHTPDDGWSQKVIPKDRFNKPSEIIVRIPNDFPTIGKTTIEIKTQFCGGMKMLNEPRTITFDKTFDVRNA